MKIDCLILAGFCALAGGGFAQPGRAAPAEDSIILPEPIPDPLERLNRGLWAVNEGAMKGVVRPSGKVWRALVPPAFRIGLSNAGSNLQFPKRVVNHLLQERWAGARNETARFLCNSVLGMGGFLNVAGEFRLERSEADFGETFGKWGWSQNFYLMLPLAGPSSDRDALGAVADSAVNPLTYFSPYSYIPAAIRYNDLTDSVEGYLRLIDSEQDAYALARDAAALLRKTQTPDWTAPEERHAPSLETLKVVLLGVRDARFPGRGRTRTAPLPGAGRQIPFTTWMQPGKAPVIYLMPGIGAHRHNSGALALAELLYGKGFSVVTISSAFNHEFIERGLSADLPGYAPSDVRDLHAALTAIDRQLQQDYPGRAGRRGLMGYSMGGFHTLLLAAHAASEPGLLRFDRYLAVDAPVRLMHAISELDRCYAAALEWPAAERTARIEQLLLKAAGLVRSGGTEADLPLSATESRFLIGLVFRLNLRDVIFVTQSRHDQGVLKEPLDPWKREPVYREIMRYSFADYLNLFAGPYYRKRGIDLNEPKTLGAASDLRTFEARFRGLENLRVIANENDLLLAPEDARWLEEVFGGKLVLFPEGGHLGNLSEAPVQVAIVNAFADLIEPDRLPAVASVSPRRGGGAVRSR